MISVDLLKIWRTIVTYWEVLVVAEVIEVLVPAIRWSGHGPKEIPGVDIVVRHFNKPLMQ